MNHKGNNIDPEILIIGEAWSQTDARNQRPFSGKSGQLLDRLLIEAGIDLSSVLYTNILSKAPRLGSIEYELRTTKQGGETFHSLYATEEIVRGVVGVNALLNKHRHSLKLIIALGNFGLWALRPELMIYRHVKGRKQPAGIKEYRGSMLKWGDEIPILATYNPADTYRNYPLRGMIRHDFKVRIPQALEGDWDVPDGNYIIRPTADQVFRTLGRLIYKLQHEQLRIAVDIETRGHFIACVGFAWSDKDAICVPLLTTDKDKKAGYWSMEEEEAIQHYMALVLHHPNAKITGQNFAFDVQYIFNELLILPKVGDDTMLKHHCLFPGGGDPIKGTGPQGLVQKNLNHLSSLYTRYHTYWKDEGKTWETNMPEEQLWVYNCKDCCATYEIAETLDSIVAERDMESQYQFQLDQLNELAIPMMLRGVKIDTNTRDKMTMELLDAIAKFEDKIDQLISEEMKDELVIKRTKNTARWFQSSTQLGVLFYDLLGIKPVYSKAGTRTTGKSALPIIGKREPLVRSICETLGTYRSLSVFFNTFISAELDHDRRIRCSFNVAGTDTFRWASSKNIYGRGTNLQNLPKGDADSKSESLLATRGVTFPNVRRLFVPDPGFLIVDADLSGADAQVVAWETGEVRLKDALRRGIKLHSVVAKELYGTDEYPYYDMCKRRIHATNYGGSARTLTQTLSGLYGHKYTSTKIEEEFQEYWFDNYHGVKRWHERVKQDLRINRGVENAFGNRIIYQDRPDSAFTNALAWVPQSTVALVCMRGALELVRNFPFLEVLLQVHDSIVFQIPKKCRTELPAIKHTLNSITIPYDDPLQIPWGIEVSDKSWGDVSG